MATKKATAADTKTEHVKGWYALGCAVIGVLGVVFGRFAVPNQPTQSLPVEHSVNRQDTNPELAKIEAKLGASALGLPVLKVAAEPILGKPRRSAIPATALVFEKSTYSLSLDNPSPRSYVVGIQFVVTGKKLVHLDASNLVRAPAFTDNAKILTLDDPEVGNRFDTDCCWIIRAGESAEPTIHLQVEPPKEGKMLVVEGYFQCQYPGGVTLTPIVEVNILAPVATFDGLPPVVFPSPD
jgi:hypothetical protein